MFPSFWSFHFGVLPLLLVVTAVPGAPKNYRVSKPGCPSQCGNLNIPYPFGIGDNCSLSFAFTLHCNTSSNPPKTFANQPLSHFEVLGISQSQVQTTNNVTFQCFDPQGHLVSNQSQITFLSTDINTDYNSPYTLSATDNKFFVIGCDGLGSLTGIMEGPGSSCRTICLEEKDIIGGYCSSNGCCQSAIPKGMKSYRISLELTHLIYGESFKSYKHCVYGFVGEESQFVFKGASDFEPNFLNQTVKNVPVVLDWVVGNENCSQAQQNPSSYACQQNTECIDASNSAVGYLCHCLPGFEGNPYLSPGCLDIDECAHSNTNQCSKVCTNTVGSYKCSCPPGFSGDGFRSEDGVGCIRNPKLIGVKLGLLIGISVVLLPLLGYWLYQLIKRRREVKRKASYFKRNGGLILQQQISSSEGAVEKTKIFPVAEMEKATDNFNQNRILGQGGQGTVYKGMMADGKIVAVKKSKKVDEYQEGQFINEIVILSQINHRNVVRLLGCCLETEVPLLVYEYIPNGTLYQHIQEPTEEFKVTWRMRLQIAAESAGALAYLHSSCSAPIYHRDIKSANILLDDKHRAKISDFGISKTITIDQTHVFTSVQGTYGYLDPEYFQSNRYTEKSDVYSFGVVLVELITGKKPVMPTTSGWIGLASEFLTCMESTSLNDMLDSTVLEEGLKEEFMAVAKLAKQCLKSNGKQRPTMKEVATVLDGIRSKHVPSSVDPGYVEIDHSMQDDHGSILHASMSLVHSNTANYFSTDVPEDQPIMYKTT